MDLGHLRSFAEVAERGTVAAAADTRGYTAPAVSQHIAKLEAELGTPLFDRVGRRLQLTDAGRALLPVALRMLDLETEGRHAVVEQRHKPHVVVAGFASALASLVIPRLDVLSDLVTIEIQEMEDVDALRDLRLARADVVLAQEYEGQPVDRDERFTYTSLTSDRLRLALPKSMPATTTLDDLATTPWLINGRGTRCERATMTILDRAGLQPAVSGSVADNQALLSLVAAGHGVTIVPELIVNASQQHVTVATQDLHVTRTIYAVTRTVAHSALVEVLDILQSAG